MDELKKRLKSGELTPEQAKENFEKQLSATLEEIEEEKEKEAKEQEYKEELALYRSDLECALLDYLDYMGAFKNLGEKKDTVVKQIKEIFDRRLERLEKQNLRISVSDKAGKDTFWDKYTNMLRRLPLWW